MEDLPFHLLNDMASEAAQRRYIVGGTADEYLLPEECINNAWHFWEVVSRPEVFLAITEDQREKARQLAALIRDGGDSLDQYDRSNIADLVQSDPAWAAIRQAAAAVLEAFGQPIDP